MVQAGAWLAWPEDTMVQAGMARWYLFVEVSFYVVFEGMGGLNVTDVKGQSIIALEHSKRIRETALAKRFGLNMMDTKYLCVFRRTQLL